MSKFTEKLTAYDSAVALMGNEEIAFVMAAACKTGNAAYMVKALSVVARASCSLSGYSPKTRIYRSAKIECRSPPDEQNR